ncbi:MAG: DUF433 domain-containing protein [Candidatus Kapaibacteriota bacterium]|jgi:uncharacterized protein (DUF433 family)
MNTAYPHIVRTEGTCGGRPRIENSRIEVRHIAAFTQLGQSVDEIAEAYPHITVAQIYASLTYYFDNKAEIDGYNEEEDRIWQEGYAAQQARLQEFSTIAA